MSSHCPTIPGGASSGLQTLTPAERHAAQNALSRVLSASGGLASAIRNLSRSATQHGGSMIAGNSASSMQIQGSGNDTFAGGSRTLMTASIANDTVVSGSSVTFDGHTGILGAQGLANFALNADTISAAGATVMSIKSQQPEESTRSHTVTLGDKTTVTITGLSHHDISKLSH